MEYRESIGLEKVTSELDRSLVICSINKCAGRGDYWVCYG